MESVEAIHQERDKAVSQNLTAKLMLLNKGDVQGNTLLHYAVAQHNLATIEYLIKQGAQIATKNHQGETAADWFQEYITSTYIIKPISQIEEIRQEIEKNNIQFVADCLKFRLSRILRFSQGETLLHYAIEAQQKAIIELLLEGISHEDIDRLLHLKDSRGVTPLALAQQRGQTGSCIAQEIVNSLQEKLRAAAAAPQMPLPRPLLAPISLEQQEIKVLADSFTHPLTSADFAQLNPQRSTIVKLAYHTCFQALQNLFPPHIRDPSSKQLCLLETLQKLFRVWDVSTHLNFKEKLRSIVEYLAHLVQQRQADQVIHFSDKKSYAEGWSHPHENKIFLNPTIIADVVALVTTLIHEVTHQVDHSYDFFPPYYSNKKDGSYFFLKKAYQLADIGAAESLTPEQRKLFEIQQLLKEGFSKHWEQNFYRWMALNSAETLAQAILALATVPVGTAKIIRINRKPILWIPSEAFLSAAAEATTFGSPEVDSTKKRHCARDQDQQRPAEVAKPYDSPGTPSTRTGSRASDSSPTLQQDIVALLPAEGEANSSEPITSGYRGDHHDGQASNPLTASRLDNR